MSNKWVRPPQSIATETDSLTMDSRVAWRSAGDREHREDTDRHRELTTILESKWTRLLVSMYWQQAPRLRYSLRARKWVDGWRGARCTVLGIEGADVLPGNTVISWLQAHSRHRTTNNQRWYNKLLYRLCFNLLNSKFSLFTSPYPVSCVYLQFVFAAIVRSASEFVGCSVHHKPKNYCQSQVWSRTGLPWLLAVLLVK